MSNRIVHASQIDKQVRVELLARKLLSGGEGPETHGPARTQLPPKDPPWNMTQAVTHSSAVCRRPPQGVSAKEIDKARNSIIPPFKTKPLFTSLEQPFVCSENINTPAARIPEHLRTSCSCSQNDRVVLASPSFLQERAELGIRAGPHSLLVIYCSGAAISPPILCCFQYLTVKCLSIVILKLRSV